MRQHPIPITSGSRTARCATTDTCQITDAWFPAGAVLQRHSHDRHVLAVMVHGGFETRIASRRLLCSTGTTWTEPCQEFHSNHVGVCGARVVVLQPALTAASMMPFRALLDAIWTSTDPALLRDTHRIATELAEQDSLSPLTLDALVLLLCARAARLTARNRMPARWLEHAREYLHAHFRSSITLNQVAEIAQVPAWRLAREFRQHFRSSIGEYARTLRLNFALEQLGSTDAPLPNVALEAGYADQSHLTRACRAATGFSPLRYRQRMRERLIPSPHTRGFNAQA